LYVTNITQAAQAVVTVSIQHQYVVGQKIHLSIPSGFGMQEADQQTAIILAVTAYTMTVDLNTSSFSAFAFPPSSAIPGAPGFATLAPAGQSTQYDPTSGVQTGYNFSYAPFHSGNFIPFMYLAAGAQSPAGQEGDVIQYQCFKYES
jgi:hypothetical protein